MDVISLMLAALALFLVVVVLFVAMGIARRLSALEASVSEMRQIVTAAQAKLDCTTALMAGRAGVAESAPSLVSCLNSREDAVRLAAAETLVRLGQPAVEPLLSALRNQDVPVALGAQMLNRLHAELDIDSFLSLPKDAQSRLLSALDKTALGSAELLRLAASASPEVLDFVLAHPNVEGAVLQAIAKKPRLSTDVQKKLALHECTDGSVVALLSSTDALGAVAAHDSLPDSVKNAARDRLQELMEHRRKEQEAAERRRRERAAEQEEEDQEDYGRGRYCTGCGGC